MSQDSKDDRMVPVMIRAYHDGYKGATAFFRNRPFLDEFFSLLTARRQQEYTILVHACSIGAEPYSLALWWLNRCKVQGASLSIHATDINAAFLEVAQGGIYPLEILEGMRPEERAWFKIDKEGVHVPKPAREMIKFLPPMSFIDGVPPGNYDAALIMNALTYVTPEQQRATIRNVAGQARHILALTAFHPDTIRQDLQAVGYCPHRNAMERIHAAWGDRLSDRPIDPFSAEYAWKLPPFDSSIPDFEYRYCALFTRSGPARKESSLTSELLKAVEELVQFAVERHRSGDIAGAQALYGKAIELSPTHPVALHNLGLIFQERGDMQSALLLLSEAVRQHPTEAAFLYSHALALQRQGNLQQALQQYDRALNARPAYREAWENRGVVLQDLERFEEAIESHQRALELDPDSPIASRNLANALRVVGRLDDALTHYRQAIGRTPMNAEMVFGYGATLITMGNFVQGWPLYEWRFWSSEFLENNPPYRVPLPRWDGGNLTTRTILVYGEQGIGDEIMFASCLNDLARIARKVILLCTPRLVPLFSRSFENIAVAAKTGDQPPHDEADVWMADCCVALGSLPGRFRPAEQSFPSIAYLSANHQAVDSWRQRLDRLGPGPKIGISWRGGAEARARTARSIALERLVPLFRIADAIFVNVQYGNHVDEIEAFNRNAAKPLVCFPEIDPMQDMDGFAALLSALDLVITVDNSTAHLAGALGMPTWLLLPAHADWRWLKGRVDTPWYSSMRIFWQERHADAAWEEVIARLGTELNDFKLRDRTGTIPAATKPGASAGPIANETGQGRPIALLLNDTAYWYHWGCTATSLALHEGLRAKGYRVDSVAINDFNRLAPLPASIEDFDSDTFSRRFAEANATLVERIGQCDAVVINGEGTLHGLGRTPLALLYTAYFAKHRLGKNTRIVNHSCYLDAEDSPGRDLAERIYRKVYGAMDYIAVRESFSARELASLGIRATEGFDCLPLYVARHGPVQASRSRPSRVVMAGSVALRPALIDTMAELANFVVGQGHKLQLLIGANAYLAGDDVRFVNSLRRRLDGLPHTLVDAHSESAWLNTIAGAELLISGRFHHTIAAACVGTPIAVASSNTRKIDGLLERLELPPENVWLNIDETGQAINHVGQLLRNPEFGLVKEGVLEKLRRQALLNFSGLPISQGT